MKKLILVLGILSISLKISAQTEGRKVRIKNNTRAFIELHFSPSFGRPIELSRRIPVGLESEINLKENTNYWVQTRIDAAPQGPNLSPEKPEITSDTCNYNIGTYGGTELPINHERFVLNAFECFGVGSTGYCNCPMTLERS